jgi:hypothetical protein
VVASFVVVVRFGGSKQQQLAAGDVSPDKYLAPRPTSRILCVCVCAYVCVCVCVHV